MLNFFNQITEWADKFTIWVALVAMLFSIFNWRNNKKGDDDIAIRLTFEGQQITLHQTTKRRHCTRSEVQGVLANMYQGQGRYKIPFLAKPEFSRRLEAVQGGTATSLTIKIEDQATYDHFQQK